MSSTSYPTKPLLPTGMELSLSPSMEEVGDGEREAKPGAREPAALAKRRSMPSESHTASKKAVSSSGEGMYLQRYGSRWQFGLARVLRGGGARVSAIRGEHGRS